VESGPIPDEILIADHRICSSRPGKISRTSCKGISYEIAMFTQYKSAIALSAALAVLAPAQAALSPAKAQALAVPNASSGNGYGEWGARWWHWLFSIPASTNPNVTAGDVQCSIGQAGDVWFLGGAFGGTANRKCTIPAGKSLFVPLVNTVIYHPKGKDTLNSLRQQADAFVSQVGGDSLYCTLDQGTCAGFTGINLKIFRATTPTFSVMPPSPGVLLPPGQLSGPGSGDKLVADGYWMLLNPLAPGEHTISFGGVWGPGVFDKVNVTYTLTVESRK
jgi:hypothetical protein